MNPTQNRRVVGKYSGAAIVISNMIGTGIFTTTGLMAEMGARSGDIIIAWMIGGLLALCGALCYGELGANMPESGGEYYYISRILHPALGFLSGWVSLIVGFSAPIAAAAMAMQIYLQHVFSFWPVRTTAVVTILIFSALHAYDLRLGARVQVVLVVLKITIILGFITGVFIAGPGPDIQIVSDISPDFWFGPSFAVILIFVAFAYFGWNAASYIGAEITKPGRNLPRALILGTVTVTVLYVLVNIAYLSASSVEQLKGVESIAGVVGTKLWGAGGGRLISFLISVGLVSTVSAMIITGPRVYEAMAKDGLFPKFLARLDKHGVPSWSVAFQAVTAIIIVMTATFGTLLIYIGFTLNIFAALTVISLFRFRKEKSSFTRVCRGYPVTPIIFLIFTIWMTVWSIRSQPVAALAGLGTLGAGYIIYLVHKAGKWGMRITHR
jgi:APA family basic amino acid/polyamine antiporter